MHKKHNKKFYLGAFALFGGWFLLSADSAPVRYQYSTNPKNLQVSAIVVGTCKLSDKEIVFDQYNPQTGASGVGEFTVECSPGYEYSIGLDKKEEDEKKGYRDLENSKGKGIEYELSKSSNGSDDWGDDEAGKPFVGKGTGREQTIKVYGDIPKGQPADATDGKYRDDVVVEFTVNEGSQSGGTNGE